MEENEVILFYICNACHEHSSKDLIGVFTDQRAYRKYLDDLKKDKILSKEDIDELDRLNQTQGRSLNYLIEVEELNPTYKA